LGIPTVVDRLIQQALPQVLQPRFEPEFSESSYGFRPGRNAQQAVEAARGYVAEGKRWVVDLDREKFFDRGNHDVRMARVARKVKDKRVLKRDPALSGSGTEGRRSGKRTPRGHPARRTVVPAAVEHSADRSGPGTGQARASLRPLCRRLQYLRRQRAERTAGDGGDHGVLGTATEAEGQRREERGGATVAAEVSGLLDDVAPGT